MLIYNEDAKLTITVKPPKEKVKSLQIGLSVRVKRQDRSPESSWYKSVAKKKVFI